MKLQRPKLSGSSESSENEIDAQIQKAMTDAIESNDKIIEISPANKSRSWGKLKMIALIGGVIGVGYWLRKSQQPTELLHKAASQTADRTKHVTEQAADTIEEGGESVAQRLEDDSETASERVEQTGEKAAEELEGGLTKKPTG